MTNTCTICGTVNSPSTTYCDGCGVELSQSIPAPSAATSAEDVNLAPVIPLPDVLDESVAPPASVVETEPSVLPSSDLTPAYLGVKKHGALTGDQLPLLGARLVMGRFDASSGPVDLDVTGLPGAEHISRRHAELAFEHGRWVVRDLGSTNGVYVKRVSEAGFSPRIQEPIPLNHGDELAVGNLMLLFQEG